MLSEVMVFTELVLVESQSEVVGGRTEHHVLALSWPSSDWLMSSPRAPGSAVTLCGRRHRLHLCRLVMETRYNCSELTHYNPQTASVSPTFIWPHYQVLTCLQRIFIFSSFLTFTFSRDREYYIIIICGNIIRIIKYVVVVIRKWMKFYLYLVGVIGANLEKIISVYTVSS